MRLKTKLSILSNYRLAERLLNKFGWLCILISLSVKHFRLCRSQWRQVTAYNHRHEDNFSFKSLYLKLDEATLTFNADPDLVSDVTNIY